MLRLSIEVAADDEVISGFELGHLTLEGDRGSCTSKGPEPDQASMVFIAITSLLDELRSLVSDPGQKEQEFVAADSSFTLRLYKVGRDRLGVSSGRTLLTEMGTLELCLSVLAGVEAFWSQYRSRLAPDDAARADLEASLAAFKVFVVEFAAKT